MSDFEPLPPHRLNALSDEELVAYVAAAHEAGATEAEREALALLAFGFEDLIKAKVALKVPTEDHADVVIEIQTSLIYSSFEGKLIGQFGAFLRTISDRRIADYWRSRSRRPDTTSIDASQEDPDRPDVEPAAEDETGLVELLAVVEAVLATREPMHQKVIRLYGPEVAGFMNLTAAETKAAIDGDGSGDTVSEANVNQIWSRFRRDVQGRLLDG